MLPTNSANIDNSQWRELSIRLLAEEIPSGPSIKLNENEVGQFLNFAQLHGIGSLLLKQHELCKHHPLLPDSMVDPLLQSRRNSSIKEVYKKRHIEKTLALLNDAQINCLLLKGTALAYSLYESPYLRPRTDCDILIPLACKEIAEETLLNAGFEKALGMSGEVVSHQASFSQTENHLEMVYDIHWKISNRNAYADRFDFDDLYRGRLPVESISSNAYRLNNIDALLHGIVHYFGHTTAERNRLIWIYDLHLIITGLTETDWQNLMNTSATRQLDPLVFEALRLSSLTFDTQIPSQVMSDLKQSEQTLSQFEQRRVSGQNWSRIEHFKSDWMSLNLAGRVKLLKEYLLPPAEFLLKQNNSTNRLLLPYFYSKRIIKGSNRLIKNTRNR